MYKNSTDFLPPKTLADIKLIEQTPLSERNLPLTTYELICRSVALDSSAVAIRYIESGDAWSKALEAGERDNSLEITYSELLEKVHQAANLFRSLGVGEDDTVSMILPNVPEAHYTLWGGETCGIVNPVNYMLEAAEIGEIIQSAGSRVIVVHGVHAEIDTWQKLPEILSKAACVQYVLVVGDQGDDLPIICKDFQKELALQPSESLNFERVWDAAATASLFHTGGTTGMPKLARHSHENEVYTSWALNCYSPKMDNTVYLTGLPLFHCYAALASGLAVFMVGGTVLLAGINGYRSPGIVLNMFNMIERYKITSFSAVPTIYGVLSQIPSTNVDLSSIQFATCGSAPMPVDLFNRFQQATGITLVEAYGLTEATVCCSLVPPDADVPRVGSIGMPIPYTKMKAVIFEGEKIVRDCIEDEVGTLLISGPSITPGYTDVSKNSSLFVSGVNGEVWLNTGDLARCDKDGYFWLTGREKELIIRGGHNIDPKTIEEVLASHPAVNLAAAVGRPDKHAGEVPVAYVDLNGEATEADLLAYCQKHIGERAAIPKAVTILQNLPVTGVGKVHKPTLNLREIDGVVRTEISQLEDDISRLDIETLMDKKYGNMATISVEVGDRTKVTELKERIESMIGVYSFKSEIKVF